MIKGTYHMDDKEPKEKHVICKLIIADCWEFELLYGLSLTIEMNISKKESLFTWHNS